MKKETKEILKKAVDCPKGKFSPADMVNGIAGGNDKQVEWLVVHKYLENVPVDKPGFHGDYYTLQFYRVSEKGYTIFAPWYKRVWFFVRGDIRTIIISVITSILTILAAIFANRLIGKFSP